MPELWRLIPAYIFQNMKDKIFKPQFTRLGDEFCGKFDSVKWADCEMDAADLLHWYRDSMTNEEIAYLEDFIEKWNRLADEYNAYFVCRTCNEPTPPFLLTKIQPDYLICQSCFKKHTPKKQKLDPQPSLFS